MSVIEDTGLGRALPAAHENGNGAAPSSPLARLRASYEARQQADPARYVDIWSDGTLVAKIARTEDIAAASSLLRAVGSLLGVQGFEQLDLSAEDLADIIASSTQSLHERDEHGEPVREPISIDGVALRFDAGYGKAIGLPDVTTSRGAVFAAFTSPATEGGPPVLDTLRLTLVAMAIGGILMAGRDTAAQTVGKASPTSSVTTPG